MKTLLLLRHAKSSWDDPALADHDRPLKPRGIKAAHRVGRLLREHGLHPQAVLCSTALRARETLRLVLDESGLQPPVAYSQRLFHCPPSEFPLLLQQVDASAATVLLVGHNPGLEDYLTQLTGHPETLPTAALARLELDLDDWSQLTDQTPARLTDLWRPKELDRDED
jgi:phosphohistidine phosphatase